ncbi:MAG: hypothetical protein U5M23_08590 [Marinagarivorans sp.]|nr:hypothetical protein [Marinagarivorans sp.]
MIAVIGIMPYISLQLKAVSASFDILSHYPAILPAVSESGPIWHDTAFLSGHWRWPCLSLFRHHHVDATEQHRGMVTAGCTGVNRQTARFSPPLAYLLLYGMFWTVFLTTLFARRRLTRPRPAIEL